VVSTLLYTVALVLMPALLLLLLLLQILDVKNYKQSKA
jgi:hypothetical protein